MPENPEKLLLSAVEVAGLLGIGKTSIYALLSAGKIPRPIKLNSRSLWKKNEIESWVACSCPPLDSWLIMKEGAK
jgi:predicted DNA-binding transcriptional regulator AlpA